MEFTKKKDAVYLIYSDKNIKLHPITPETIDWSGEIWVVSRNVVSQTQNQNYNSPIIYFDITNSHPQNY